MQINEIQVSVESLYKAWIVGSSQLQPLAQAVRDSILEGVSLADVTHVRRRVRDSDSMKESYKKCSLFGLMGVNKEVFYEYGETLLNRDFESVYQGVIFPFASDAAAGFKNLAKRLNVKQACCNGHARRKFKQAKNYNIKLSLEALSFYKELFLIESNIFSLSPEEKLLFARFDQNQSWMPFGSGVNIIMKRNRLKRR